MITKFRNENFFLSNFYQVNIPFYTKSGLFLNFPSVENYYQAMKTLDEKTQVKMCSISPADAKRLGKKIGMHKHFEMHKQRIMYEGVYRKFSNPELKLLLLNTGNKQLIEGNTWGDTYWGVCNGKGSNFLGKILMDIREMMRKKNPHLLVTTSNMTMLNMFNSLDITAKGAAERRDWLGSIFAPPKEIVYAFKYRGMSEYDYAEVYTKHMTDSLRNNRQAWNYVLSGRNFNFVCYCTPRTFCHRLLLADLFKQLGAVYVGELFSKGDV